MIIATRLICSMSWWHVALLLCCLGLIGPFVQALVGETRRDARKAALWGLTIVAIVITLMATAEAAGPIVIRDQCATCHDSGAPAWVCWLYCL